MQGSGTALSERLLGLFEQLSYCVPREGHGKIVG